MIFSFNGFNYYDTLYVLKNLEKAFVLGVSYRTDKDDVIELQVSGLIDEFCDECNTEIIMAMDIMGIIHLIPFRNIISVIM